MHGKQLLLGQREHGQNLACSQGNPRRPGPGGDEVYKRFFKIFDGTLGWSEEAPYDAIIVRQELRAFQDLYRISLKSEAASWFPSERAWDRN